MAKKARFDLRRGNVKTQNNEGDYRANNKNKNVTKVVKKSLNRVQQIE